MLPRVEATRYGIDGWPYVVGLTGGSLLVGAAALGVHGRARTTLAAVALTAAVPATLGGRYVLGGKLRHRDRLLELVPWRGDETVLDVGAGAGLMGVGAARRVPHGRVLCVDLWVGKDLAGGGPHRLRANAEQEGVADRVDVHTGDARALDVPDESVDVVVSVLCLHNLPDERGRQAAATEIARVLRPGGHVVVADLAGTGQLARWFEDLGLHVLQHRRAPDTFPPQKVVVARRPG